MKRVVPAWPCRPARPLSWSSTRLDGLISVPMTCRPVPASGTMSVPRPAMLVATVTAPGCPADFTIAPSSALLTAFSVR